MIFHHNPWAGNPMKTRQYKGAKLWVLNTAHFVSWSLIMFFFNLQWIFGLRNIEKKRASFRFPLLVRGDHYWGEIVGAVDSHFADISYLCENWWCSVTPSSLAYHHLPSYSHIAFYCVYTIFRCTQPHCLGIITRETSHGYSTPQKHGPTTALEILFRKHFFGWCYNGVSTQQSMLNELIAG